MNDRISERPSVRLVAGPAGFTAGGVAGPRRFWGMTSRQRLERALTRAGAPIEPSAPVLVRDDFIFDEMLIPALLRQPGVLLTDADGEPVAGHIAEATQPATVEAALGSGAADSIPI